MKGVEILSMATFDTQKQTFQYPLTSVFAAAKAVLSANDLFTNIQGNESSGTLSAEAVYTVTEGSLMFRGLKIPVRTEIDMSANNVGYTEVRVTTSLTARYGAADKTQTTPKINGIILTSLTEELKNYEQAVASGEVTEDTDELVYELNGGSGDILLVYKDRVILKHKGVLNLMAMGIKGDKTIYYSDITAVEYKQPGFTAGRLQFSFQGGIENKGGLFGATSDENTITISDTTVGYLAEKIADYINKRIREIKTKNSAPTATTIVQQLSAADELKKFKELLDMGIITQEEFDAKKKQLLGL